MLNVLDPRAEKQLTKGLFPIESNVRWSGRTFTAILKPPPNATRKGSVLLLRFGVPESSMIVLGSFTITATVNGTALDPQSFNKAGEFDYTRDVPASAFHDGNATVDFVLDKAMAPHDNERRELGIVVNTVGFEAK